MTTPPSPIPSHDTIPPFDNGERLRLLHADVGPFIEGIVGRFLEKLPERLQAIGAAIASEDRSAIFLAAHKLKGSAATLGAEGMVQFCDHLETISRSDQPLRSDLMPALEEHARIVAETMPRTVRNLLESR